MWKKWLAFSGMLGLIVLLDPTPTPAQPGGGKGGKGGFGRDNGGGGGFPGGGGGGFPGAGGGGFQGGGFPGAGGSGFQGGPGGGGRDRGNGGGFQGGGGGFPGAGGGGFQGGGMGPGGGGFPGSGGFPGGGFPGGSGGGTGPGGGRDRGNGGGFPGAPGGGGFPGAGGGPGSMGPGGGPGGGGGMGRGIDPERGWSMLQRLTNSTGDTVDLGAIPPQTRDFLKNMTERMGGRPLPESGTMSKAQYLEYHAANEAARAASAGNGGGPGRGPGGMGPGGPGNWGGGPGGFGGSFGGWGGGENGWGGGDQRQFEKRETEEEKPIAMRYGKLPKDLPSWFEQDDTDKDGQVGLYEWRKAGKDIQDFMNMDLNNDGFVTADEYLRFTRQQSIDAKIANYEENGTRPANWGIGSVAGGNEPKGPGRGPGGFGPGSFGPGGGGPGMGGPKGGDRGDRGDRGSEERKGERKGNPFNKKG